MNYRKTSGVRYIQTRGFRSAIITVAAAISLLSTQGVAAAGNVWVVTIAVNDYQKLPPNKQLRFCRNDEEMLISRLREGNRVTLPLLCRFRSGGPADLTPTKQNIERELPEFLAETQSDDVVIIFVSMHGASIPTNSNEHTTVLLPENADPADLANTTISLNWLRDLLCRRVTAKRIMLIMDSCHSGGIRPEGETTASPLLTTTTRDIRVTFEQTLESAPDRSIYVLTSCDEKEMSLESPDTNHGMFTHWLICGMDGAADRNEDAIVSMDELFGFVCDMVPRSAEYYSQATKRAVSQHPQRILLGANHGDIPLLALCPQTPDQAFQRLAVGIDSLVRHSLVRMQDRPNRQPLIMLAELSAEQSANSSGAEFGSFPLISRKKIEDCLLERVGQLPQPFTYAVADARTMELKQRDISLLDLQEGRIQNGELDAVVFGTFRREGQPGSLENPDRLCITIKVRQTQTGSLIGFLRTSILIDPQFLMMFGGSHDSRLQRHRDKLQVPKVPAAGVPESAVPMLAASVPTVMLQQQSDVSQSATQDHPLVHQEWATLNVRVLQRRPDEAFSVTPWNTPSDAAPNTRSFATRKGNILALELVNQTEEPLAVIVQIDGVNQIGRNVAIPAQSCYWSVQPRGKFTVDQWMDRPDIKPDAATYSVSGGSLLVSSPPESVAGRQKVTDQLGEIRIVVFGMKKVPAGSRSMLSESQLGIAESQQIQSKQYIADRSRIIDTSNHKATYVLRYFDDSLPPQMVRNESSQD